MKMELRPVQTALFAGRAASRWAASTSTATSKPPLALSLCVSTLSRSFSSSRPTLQEAEAVAPLPSGGMGGYFKQRQQQQQLHPSPLQQRQQQQQRQQRQQQQSRPTPNPNNMLRPWASQHSNVQIVPSSARNPIDRHLADLGIDQYANPTAEDLEKQKNEMYYEKPIDIKYRLRPVIGRTVNLTTAPGQDEATGRRIDFAKGLLQLDMQCRVNRVRLDSNQQRYHERKGLKKKRLRSERWQRRFMQGFKATCKRVNELAKQGW